MSAYVPPSFEDHTSPLTRSNDGRLVIAPQSNPPKSFTVSDERDKHVELFTQERKIADAFVAGYDYCERLSTEGLGRVHQAHKVEYDANVARIQLLIEDAKGNSLGLPGFAAGLARALQVLEGRG